MPSRNERRRATLIKERAALEAKKLPIDRKIAFIDSQIVLLDEYEASELKVAQESLGLTEE